MKKLILITSIVAIAFFSGCNKDDDKEAVATCTDGIQNGIETGIDCGGICNSCSGIAWTSIATDPAGDAANNGLDAIGIEYQYDAVDDVVRFKVEFSNLSSFGDSPSADFSFGLPNGTENNDPPGYHWTDTNQITLVHRTAAIYCDTGGAPPSNYTYIQSQATNSIYLTSNPSVVSCQNCIAIVVDPTNNIIVYTIARSKIINNVEMGGNSATIKLVANVGHNIGWDDNITVTGSFMIVTP